MVLVHTFDLRFLHGIHALDIHFLFVALEASGTALGSSIGSSCSFLGRIARISLM